MAITTNGQVGGKWWEELANQQIKISKLDGSYKAFLSDYGKTKEINKKIVEGFRDDYVTLTDKVINNYQEVLELSSENATLELVDARQGKENLGELTKELTNSLEEIATVYASRFKTNVNDWGQAINEAINSISGGVVILPKGILSYSNPIIQKTNITLKGQGKGVTILSPIDCHGISCKIDTYLRDAYILDLTIKGNNDGDMSVYDKNKNGINWNSGSLETYRCSIKNVDIINCYGKGIFIPNEFTINLENVSVTGCGGHAIELEGGNTTTLLNCYAHKVAPNMCGYRIYGAATLISCNGLDSGDYWGIFGRNNGEFEDSSNGYRVYKISLINCNLEDFKKTACVFIYGGRFNLHSTTFFAPSDGTFDYYLDMTAPNPTCFIGGDTNFESKGSLSNYAVPFKSSKANASIFSLSPSFTKYLYNGNIVELATIGTEYSSYLQNTLVLSYANIKNMDYYFLGGKKHDFGTALPTSGTFLLGDRRENTTPTAGGYVGWICTTSGKAHLPSTGDITTDLNTIVNVTNITTWSVGDIIKGNGIQNNTTVTEVNTAMNTLTISNNVVGATAAGIKLYDAVFKGYGLIEN